MIVRELIEILINLPPEYELYVNTPNRKMDYFVESVTAEPEKEQVFIETAQ